MSELDHDAALAASPSVSTGGVEVASSIQGVGSACGGTTTELTRRPKEATCTIHPACPASRRVPHTMRGAAKMGRIVERSTPAM